MKNLKSTDPIYIGKKYGWCQDIYQSKKRSYKTEICTVWGSTEEVLNHRVIMIKKASEMHEALKDEIELLKIDLKFQSSEMMIDGYQSRINKLESLLKELEP